ncbi:MAG: hypothetical protein LBU89_14650 [Fibromonadaceae bacterium]|jgi:hypothetical protein|nr:hypothetical protein [Fibromonadaceae bacterium]
MFISYFDSSLLLSILLNEQRAKEASISRHYNRLAKCKSLDAIHLAAALDAQSNPNNKTIRICSFDKNMLVLANQLGFETFG